MRIKHLSFEMFRQNNEKFDDIVLELEDGSEFIIHNNTDYEFNDRKKRVD